jgi:tetratricopeptide (TPR) repeat protein
MRDFLGIALASVVQRILQVLAALGTVSKRSGRLNAAAALHRKVLQLLLEAGDLKGALVHLERAVEINPSHPEPRYRLGRALRQVGELERAAVHLLRAVEIDSGHAAAHEELTTLVPEARLTPSLIKPLMGGDFTDDVQVTHWDLTEQARAWFRLSSDFGTDEWHSNSPRRIAIFAVYPAMLATYTAMSVVLLRMGHSVDLVWRPRAKPDVRPDNGWEHKLVANEMAALAAAELHPKLLLHRLEDYERTSVPEDIRRKVEEQAFADVQTCGKDPYIDLEDETVAGLYQYRLEQNLEAVERLNTFLGEHGFNYWIVDSGGGLEFGAAYPLLEALGIKRVCVAFQLERYTISISVNRPFPELDVEEAWKADEPHRLSPERKARLETWARQTETVEYFAEKTNLPSQRSAKLAADKLWEELGLDPGRPLALVLPSISWDTTVLIKKRHRAFSNQREWLLGTVAYFIDHPDLQLVIRPHPHEHHYNSPDTTNRAVRAKWDRLPGHIHLLQTDTTVNTYGLIDIAVLGLVYTSDVGWEMPIRGKPVICGGRSHYAGLGFTHDAMTPEDYFALLDRFCADPGALRVSARQKELAWCYADLYTHKTRKPFPWLPGRLWTEDLERHPMSYVLSPEGMEKFGETFKILSGEISTYEGFVGDLPTAATSKSSPSTSASSFGCINKRDMPG